jgi:hypothetical protein
MGEGLKKMDAGLEYDFLRSFQQGFKASYLGEIYSWAAENVTLPVAYNPPGQFDVTNGSRYLIEPFKALRDVHTRTVCLMAPPRSGKTLLGELWMLFLICNNPGPFLWIQSSDKSMGKMGDLRMTQLLKMCRPVSELIDTSNRFSITKNRFSFANNMNVNLGSAKIRDLQSVGYQFICFDEVWMAEQGFIAEAKARQGDWPETSKFLLISQGGTAGDEWTSEFERGQVYEYAWVCPNLECKKEQLFHWNFRRPDGSYAGMVWDRACKVEGVWNYEAAGKSAALECIDCKDRVTDTPVNREYLDSCGRYLLTKEGDPAKKSFRYNALANKRVSFSELVQEFLYASDVADNEGNNPLKEIFQQKRLAISSGTHRDAPIINLNLEDYDSNAEWPEEKRRFLTVDVQRKAPKFWWVVRAWAANGDSRLIAYGNCNSWEELETVRINHKVKLNRTFVDSGDGQNTHDIYTECAKHGKWVTDSDRKQRWISYVATKGSGNNSFAHKENGKELNRPYGKEEIQAASLGNDPKYKNVRGCPFYLFSNLQLKSILEHLRDGKGAKWVANEVCENYKAHMKSEVLAAVIKGNKSVPRYVPVTENADNHWWDCEVLQVLAASLNKLLSLSLEEKKHQQTEAVGQLAA